MPNSPSVKGWLRRLTEGSAGSGSSDQARPSRYKTVLRYPIPGRAQKAGEDAETIVGPPNLAVKVCGLADR
jgi:hypothetical protein